MNAENARSRPYCSFAPLVFSMTGWALISAWLLAVEAGLRSFVVAAIPGLILTIRSTLRRPAFAPEAAETGTGPVKETRSNVFPGAVLLFGSGAILGMVVLSAWLILFAAVAVAYLFVPLSRVPLCRRYAGWTSIVMSGGCLSVVAAGHRQVDVMFLLLASWILWTCACCALLLQMHQQRNAARDAEAKCDASARYFSTERKTGPSRQSGAFTVMFVPLLIVVIGFCSLALEMGKLYNRKVDLHGMAQAVALAAARELNGTPAGIAAAKTAARQAAERLRFHHFDEGATFTWSEDALSFSSTSAHNGTWIPAAELGEGNAEVATAYFVRVSTAGLDISMRIVDTVLIRIFDNSLSTIELNDTVIAGKTSVALTPIGICAMSPDPAASRSATTATGGTVLELVQYGFRRGVSYDLMKLNPNGVQPLRYAINPVSLPGTTSSAFDIAALEPFVCTGSMWVQRVTGGAIRVSELPASRPLASLQSALNTRFDDYAGTACRVSGAPPDINIKSYAYNQANSVRWMSPATGSPAAASTTVRDKLETVADLPTPPSSPGDYGPLWAYAKAARAPTPLNSPEPVNGYATFPATDWPTLYKSGPTTSTYPTTSRPATPYQYSTPASGHYTAPSTANRPRAVPGRRVLHIPLLTCSPSAPAGSNAQATVGGIAKFFMTARANDESLIGEFAGLVSHDSLQGQVEIFP